MELTDHITEGYCEVRIRGRLEPRWTEWFDLMEITARADETIISGIIPDQAALQGLMEKMSMLGMTIVSIDFKRSTG